MVKMIFKKTVRILVSAMLFTIHYTHFKFAVYLVLNNVLKAIRRKRYFKIYFFFHKCNVISIINLKQSKITDRNPIKPEVFVMFGKDQGIGSQSEVKVNALFLTI